MRFKLDENFPRRAVESLLQAGHEALTVADENLSGADDRAVIGAALTERRCLVTLDLDFGNPLLFDPRQYAGIVVVRLPPRASLQDLVQGVETLVRGLGDPGWTGSCGSLTEAGFGSISRSSGWT